MFCSYEAVDGSSPSAKSTISAFSLLFKAPVDSTEHRRTFLGGFAWGFRRLSRLRSAPTGRIRHILPKLSTSALIAASILHIITCAEFYCGEFSHLFWPPVSAHDGARPNEWRSFWEPQYGWSTVFSISYLLRKWFQPVSGDVWSIPQPIADI